MTCATLSVHRASDTDHEALTAKLVLSSRLLNEQSASWPTDISLTALGTLQSGWTPVATLIEDPDAYRRAISGG